MTEPNIYIKEYVERVRNMNSAQSKQLVLDAKLANNLNASIGQLLNDMVVLQRQVIELQQEVAKPINIELNGSGF